MSSPQQGQVHMMVMPKCNEPSAAAKAAAEAKKKEESKDQQKKSDPLTYQKQIYPVDSFYQKLIDIQYVIYEDEKTIALMQLK